MAKPSVKIVRLDINEEDEFSGVDAIALVENPAIESNWMYFSDHKFESYSDYPDSVSNNAKRGIELNEKVNNKCATQVGKVRAQQLAKKEPISVETIKRMYSYLSRAEAQYRENESDTEACSVISYLLWGGLAAKSWAESKLKELDLFEGAIDVSGLAPYINEPSGSLVVKLNENDDKEMVDGIVELLVKVEDLENRKQMVIDTIKDFAEQGVVYNLDDFLSRVGVSLSDLDFVDPRAGESEDDFINRCVPVVINEGKDQEQAVAICYSLWRDRFEDDKEIEKILYSYVSGLFELLGFLDGLPVFATPQEAEEVAEIAGCKGYHEHQMGEFVVYMPCEEHEPEWDDILTEAYEEWEKSKLKSWKDLSETELEGVLDYLDSVAEVDVLVDQEKFAKPLGKIPNGVRETDRSMKTSVSFLDTPTTKIRYKYNGPVDDKNRDFCRVLMTRYTNQNKVFKKEDINQMSIAGVNTGFGPGGVNQYDIFSYRGGVNCRHTWQEVKYSLVNGVWADTTMVVQTPTQRQETPPVDTDSVIGRLLGPNAIGTQFSKQKFDEQQIVAGPLMIPDKLIYRFDETNGEYFVYFSEDTIQKIAYKYMQNKYTDNTNLEHMEELALSDVFVVESWIVSDPERDKSSIYSNGEKYPKGTWYGMVKVKNKQIWDEYVKTGLVRGFSVEGFFIDELLNKTEKSNFQ